MTLLFIRLLKDFVEKNGKGLEVVYIVSGWLKNTPSDHRTRLVSSSKLSGYNSKPGLTLIADILGLFLQVSSTLFVADSSL